MAMVQTKMAAAMVKAVVQSNRAGWIGKRVLTNAAKGLGQRSPEAVSKGIKVVSAVSA